MTENPAAAESTAETGNTGAMDIGEQKEPVIPAAGEIMKREVTMKREVMPIRARALIRMTESGGSTC